MEDERRHRNCLDLPFLYHFVFREVGTRRSWRCLWEDEAGQDIAEYAVMLAVILAIVVGTIRLIGASANNVFSSVASSIQ